MKILSKKIKLPFYKTNIFSKLNISLIKWQNIMKF